MGCDVHHYIDCIVSAILEAAPICWSYLYCKAIRLSYLCIPEEVSKHVPLTLVPVVACAVLIDLNYKGSVVKMGSHFPWM